MKILKRQSGFTLVEVVIVMALTALAASLYVAGQGTQRQQTQFTVDVNKLVSQIKEVQSDAQNGVLFHGNLAADAGPTGDSKYAVYGTQIEFWDSGFYSWDLVTPATDGSCPAGDEGLQTDNLCQLNRNFNPYPSDLKFMGDDDNGFNEVGQCSNPLGVFYVTQNNLPAGIGTPTCGYPGSTWDQKIPPDQVKNTGTYYFEDVDNSSRKAILTINPTTNTVSVSFP